MHLEIEQMIAKAVESFQIGDFDGAESLLIHVLKNEPSNFDALHILGVIKGTNNLHHEALDCFSKALNIAPNNSYLHFNIAKAFSEIGEHQEALKHNLNSTQLNPEYPEGWVNYGKSLLTLGRVNDAFSAIENAINLNPNYAEAWSNRGVALTDLKSYKEAIASFDKALQINPQLAEAWSNRGVALQNLKYYEQSLASYDKAISINPNYAEAWSNRGNALQDLKHYQQSLASYDKAISIKPEYAEAWSNRGNALNDVGLFTLAEASHREAIRCDPNYFSAYSNLLFTLNHNVFLNPQNALKEAKIYGAKISDKSTPKFTKWNVDIETKKLKIGFISGDICNHPVGYFVEGLIECLEVTKFELHAFPTISLTDDLTDRVKPFFTKWSPIYGMTDRDAASVIHNSGIHILIDLSGHTAHNRLPVFSYRPAPVQASWLGYFATTGLPEMDYFIGDPHMSITKEEIHFTEAAWKLPDTWLCLKPPNFQLLISPLPALNNGFVTFGSFGSLSKVNDIVLETWATVLKLSPKSKLLMKTKQFEDSAQIEVVQDRFAKFGVSPDRLILEGPGTRENYYKTYSRVDVVLDTFPYPGGTTSVDALWMGVPVITLKGDRFLSHLGESIAINAENTDWIAQGEDDYVRKAVEFSFNLKRLEYQRSTLRDRVLKSPLFDTNRFAKNFSAALWGMWLQRKN